MFNFQVARRSTLRRRQRLRYTCTLSSTREMCDATDIIQIIYDCAPSTTTREKVGVDEKQRFFDVDPTKLINQRVYDGSFFSAGGCVLSGGHNLRPQLRAF